MSENTAANIEALLDSSLDDLADLPEFAVYPAGSHRVLISMQSKVVNDHPSIEVGMKAVETIELVNAAEDQPLAPGAETSVLYMLDNEFSQGKLKKLLKGFAEHYGVSSIREIMDAANGAEVVAVTKVRQNKDKSQSYTDLVNVLFE